jgi:hypothetical protein
LVAQVKPETLAGASTGVAGFSSWKGGGLDDTSGSRAVLPVTRIPARPQLLARVAGVLGGERVRLKVLVVPPEGADEYSGRPANKGVNLTLRSAERHRPLGLHLAAGGSHVCSRRLHPTR